MFAKLCVCFILLVIATELESAKSRPCKLMPYGPFGGRGGTPWTDLQTYKRGGKITQINVCFDDDRIRGLWMRYGNIKAPEHGHSGPKCDSYIVDIDDAVIAVKGSLGVVAGNKILKEITFDMKKGRSFGPFGKTTSDTFSYYADGRPLAYVAGFAGLDIDQITFYVTC